MNDKAKEAGKGGDADLKGVAAAIEILWRLGKEAGAATKKKKSLFVPDYPNAADGLERIATMLRDSFDRLVKFINEAIDIGNEDIDKTKLRAFVQKYRDANVESLASQIKARCGEIDNIYNSNVDSWLKSFLGIRNKFAERIRQEKGEAADAIVKRLTRFDAQLQDDLIKNVINPLRDFAVRAVDAKDQKERKRVHREMQEHFREIIPALERDLRRLDKAVDKFSRLAKSPRLTPARAKSARTPRPAA